MGGGALAQTDRLRFAAFDLLLDGETEVQRTPSTARVARLKKLLHGGSRLHCAHCETVAAPTGVAARRLDSGTDRMVSETSSCLMLNQRIPGLVCFGADEDTYQKYLSPNDAGPVVGQCPTPDDFSRVEGEGAVSYFACGPLSQAEIAIAHDAGVPLTVDGGTENCCFWVIGIPGP